MKNDTEEEATRDPRKPVKGNRSQPRKKLIQKRVNLHFLSATWSVLIIILTLALIANKKTIYRRRKYTLNREQRQT